MNTVFRICVGATIAIFAGLVTTAAVLNVHIENGLAVAGFFFIVGLPLYVAYRIGEKRDKNEMTAAVCEFLDRCKQALDETEGCLDDSIEEFKEWGRYIKDWERDDERACYAEAALKREVGMHTGGLSAEYGAAVSRLVEIRRKLHSIRYAL